MTHESILKQVYYFEIDSVFDCSRISGSHIANFSLVSTRYFHPRISRMLPKRTKSTICSTSMAGAFSMGFLETWRISWTNLVPQFKIPKLNWSSKLPRNSIVQGTGCCDCPFMRDEINFRLCEGWLRNWVSDCIAPVSHFALALPHCSPLWSVRYLHFRLSGTMRQVSERSQDLILIVFNSDSNFLLCSHLKQRELVDTRES